MQLNLGLTDILALWGAVVSTIVAGWNVYKDFLKRTRVKVTAGFQLLIPPGDDIFVFRVNNQSDHPIRIQTCGGSTLKMIHIQWVQRLINRMRPESEGYPDFLFAGVTVGGHTLPITVPPKDSFSVVYPIKPNDFPEVRELYVTTTDGKIWLCPRQNIRAIHKDKVYKALRQKRYIPYNERKKLKASKN